MWTRTRRAKIVYFEKKVHISSSNEENLEVQGERPEGNLKQLKTMKVNELKLKDILVVREFLVKNWKPPKIPTDFRSLLGLVRNFRRFIANFLKIAKPLTLLTHKDKKYEWGDVQENAFQTLKDMFCDASILALPKGTDDFAVYRDTSNQGKAKVVGDALSRKEWMKPR
nr:putative reverse transcriptase domain-containing protein [Tanacetum cinerariifolium]